MKNSGINVKEKLIARYLEKDPPSTQSKSSNINVLLNRIAVNKKNESRKKLKIKCIDLKCIIITFVLY